MKVIEFSGLPGSGKTTLINCILSNIDNNNIITRKELFNNFNKSSLLDKCIYSILCIDLDFFILLLYLAIIYNSDFKFVKKLIGLYLCMIYHQNTSIKDVILDEGFLQFITSIIFDLKLKDNKKLDKFVRLLFRKFNIIEIRCDINIDIAIKRIKERKRNLDRYSYNYDNTELKNLLTTKEYNLNLLLKYARNKITVPTNIIDTTTITTILRTLHNNQYVEQ